MGWGRAAGVLIALLISCALIDVARGGDLAQCEPQRVTGGYWAYRIIDGRECWYQGRPGKPKNELFWPRSPTARQPMDQPEGENWAYRIIDGRECWYQGRPGKPKNELFWPRAPSAPQPMDQPEAETKVEPPDPSSLLVAAPPKKPDTCEAGRKKRAAPAAGQVPAFTSCWPESEEPAPLPQPTQEPAPLPQPTLEPPAWAWPPAWVCAWPLALVPLGLYALWWIARPRRALRAVRAQHAGRVAAAQPHPAAPPRHPARA